MLVGGLQILESARSSCPMQPEHSGTLVAQHVANDIRLCSSTNMRNKCTSKKGDNAGRSTNSSTVPKKDSKPGKRKGSANHIFNCGVEIYSDPPIPNGL